MNSKYQIQAETKVFNSLNDSICHLRVFDSDDDRYDRTTLLSVNVNSDKIITIRVDWCNMSGIETEFKTLLIPETEKLFFGARFFWGVIDLKEVRLMVQKNCQVFWNFERYLNAVVVISELAAESYDLSVNKIDEVSVEPPFEVEYFNDKIEFTSAIFGLQKLKLNY
jgi:hypothetical protein